MSMPIFEQTVSALFYSNDARLRLYEVRRKGQPTEFTLRYDGRDDVRGQEFEGEEVFRTLDRVKADAYIAGYDLAMERTRERNRRALDARIREAAQSYAEADEASGEYGEGGQESMEIYAECGGILSALQEARKLFVGSELPLNDPADDSDVSVYGAGC